MDNGNIDISQYRHLQNEYWQQPKKKVTKRTIRKQKKKIFFLNIFYFPTLLLNFIKKILFRLFKVTIGGVVVVLLLIYYTDSSENLYFQYSKMYSDYKITIIEKIIDRAKKDLDQELILSKCFTIQGVRELKGEKTKIWFCRALLK